MNAQMVNRSVGIDALRVVGLVAVVVGHVWVEQTRPWLYSWHVPLFFFLAGWFWTTGRSLRAELLGRVRTLLVPYAAWLLMVGAVAVVVSRVRTSAMPSGVDLMLGGNHIGRPFSAFWFVTALVAAAILLRCLERAPAWMSWTIGSAGAVAAAVAPHAVAAVPLSIGIAIPGLLFMLVGRTARRSGFRDARVAMIAAGSAFAAVALGVAPLDLKNGDLGTPALSVVVAVMICWSATVLAERCGTLIRSRRLSVAITSLGSVGIGVVLLHALPLWLIDTSRTQQLLALVVALAGSFGGCLLIARTSLAPWLLGVRRHSTGRHRKPVPFWDA